jgi:hypothetical protein
VKPLEQTYLNCFQLTKEVEVVVVGEVEVVVVEEEGVGPGLLLPRLHILHPTNRPEL